MDSQREENTSFVGLLNQDYYESMGSPNPSFQMDETQVDVESGVKKARGGNFTIEEDILLVQAWINTSIDPVNGNEQSKKAYWFRIWETYHDYKAFDTPRSQTSLANRWGIIQKNVNKFCGCLTQVESLHQSGLSQQDKIDKAKEMYRKVNNTTFLYEHCWNVLKTCPKWSTYKEKPKKRSFEHASSTSTQAPINLNEDNISTSNFVDLERPEGRKAAKERLNKQKSKDSVDEKVLGLLTQMNERAMRATERKLQLMEEASARESEKVRMEKSKIQVEEDKIMVIDTSGMSELQREYIRIRQMEIIERRKMT